MNGPSAAILWALAGVWCAGVGLALAWWFDVGRHP